jgi:hypothetical protein
MASDGGLGPGMRRDTAPVSEGRLDPGMRRDTAPVSDGRLDPGMRRDTAPVSDGRLDPGMRRDSAPVSDGRLDPGMRRDSAPVSDGRLDPGMRRDDAAPVSRRHFSASCSSSMLMPSERISFTSTLKDSGMPAFISWLPSTMALYICVRPFTSSDLTVSISCNVYAAP